MNLTSGVIVATIMDEGMTLLAAQSSPVAGDPLSLGWSSLQARQQLEQYGPNEVPDTRLHPLQRALVKFWAPVPWMLEAAVLLQLFLGDYMEAAMVAGLLFFNAALGFFQETRAQATLQALRSRLALTASVRRDGTWVTLPAVDLVPGDRVKLSLGGVVAADVQLIQGSVLLDQSMLTGESEPIEAGPGAKTYAGALVRRGEAEAVVIATGVHTQFGHTAELVRTAHVVSSQQKAVLRVVRNLAGFSAVVIALLLGFALSRDLPMAEIIPLILTAVLASIPVALPATFTLAAAIGAKSLAKLGVLPTRLSAVDEAATIDILCADKTGTLTRNELSVTRVYALPGFDAAHVLGLSAVASSEGGQDSVDVAIRKEAVAVTGALSDLPALVQFIPFDPATKMSEAQAKDAGGQALRIVKGAFAVVAKLAQPCPEAQVAAQEFENQGLRVLAVAVGQAEAMQMAGLVALSDQPRKESAALIAQLHDLGVRTVMVTGDAVATATFVARAVGLGDRVCPAGAMDQDINVESYAVFAGVLPEDKYALIQAFQRRGHTVGMCGDGVNDAPALRQAQMGIAVSTATDVAKSAAGMVLTEPGLQGILAAVKEGRTIFQRIQTYTLNSIIKKIVTVLLLILGLVLTGHAILTPLLMVILLIAGDFLAMSLTTDHVHPSPMPNAWRIGNLTVVGVILGLCLVIFCTLIIAFGELALHLNIRELRTLTFIVLVFGSQSTIYAIRERKQLWQSRPSFWLVLSSLADILLACFLSLEGIAMSPLPVSLVFATLAAAIVFALLLDMIKRPVMAGRGIV